ncbi:MAG: (Fe-S)-binding protein [Deltaproteobacteria bacterium HGW-Deltaproteobacteria-19]|jgi:ferredoxin|nr:MAG: (Fe-S)-binding protein [Deltaproteobacteria bacterium HGW-Deltaproteobacteria-19]
MSHHLQKTGYTALVDRLNRFPQGAPPSELLFKILKILFREKEAGLVALLPIRPFTVAQAAARWKMGVTEARKILDELAGRAILLDTEDEKGVQTYVLPPPMAGFFEFSLMRTRGDIDQKVLSELFYQYLNVEDDFIRELFADGETRLGRAFVHEPALPDEPGLVILDYERATEVIRTSPVRGVSTCYCRHKMGHLGRACDAPLAICMTFNASAESLVKHGHARAVGVEEGLDLLREAWERNLVQFGSNVREKINFICNCCGCCCEAMIAARRFSLLQPVHTTNFLPEVQEDGCTGCGRCANVCPVEAMSLVSANDPRRPKKRKAQLRAEVCLGCGLCVRACPESRIRLVSRPERVITPLDTAHLAVVMAVERGKLQDLIFDNRALFSHRAMAAILGTILRMPPVTQVMASRQMKSRYLETLIGRMKNDGGIAPASRE